MQLRAPKISSAFSETSDGISTARSPKRGAGKSGGAANSIELLSFSAPRISYDFFGGGGGDTWGFADVGAATAAFGSRPL
jgi:hypothetical protein